jgi:hypothetical protein
MYRITLECGHTLVSCLQHQVGVNTLCPACHVWRVMVTITNLDA